VLTGLHSHAAPSVRTAGYGRVALGCRPGAHHAGLRLEDVPRPSLAQLIRRDKLDAKIGQALKQVLRT
jgi:hypothetical protein